MSKPLTYLATAVVACIASPFVALAAIMLPLLVLFVVLSVLGVITVAVTFLIPIMVSIGIVCLAAYLLFKLLSSR